MYNYQLKAFITVADLGSFTKASEVLFISSTAVMKQINTLEKHFGFKLFDRSPSGATLTPAGKVIYKHATLMIQQSEQAINEALSLVKKTAATIRVASTHLNPCRPLIDLWRPVSSAHPEFQLKIIPFEDDFNTDESAVENLGKKVDVMVVPNDAKEWLSQYNFYIFGYSKISFAVPYNHRLADLHVLSLDDLHGENLMMVKEGNSYIIDAIRDEIVTYHPEINIIDMGYYYTMDFFNQANDDGCILLSIDHWKDVHPSLIDIPADWNYEMPYGLLYSLDPPEHVEEFVRCVRENRPLDSEKRIESDYN